VIWAILTLLVLAPYAGAQVYKWVDEKGNLHFADDLSNVPEKYRPGAEVRKPPREAQPQPKEADRAAPLPETPVSRPAEPQGFDVKLFRSHELLLTEVLLNGRVKQRFLVDTGASFSLISTRMAEELGIVIDETTPFIQVSTASGVVLTPLVTLKSVQVGRAQAEDVIACIYNMPSGGGLLGNSFLNRYRVVIDSASEKMTLFPMQGLPSPDRPGGFSRDFWSGQFRFLHGSLESLQRLKARLERSGTGNRVEISRVGNAIRYFENQLSDLDRKASLAGVPRTWRE
jgi:clan AA aspartic protease (TIGR02281 family)